MINGKIVDDVDFVVISGSGDGITQSETKGMDEHGSGSGILTETV